MLQPCRLIGHHRVGRRVGLIEGILGEINHLIVNLLGCGLRNPICNAAGHSLFLIPVYEVLPLLLHDRGLLLRHGAAHQIAPSQRVARQLLYDLHDLLLIDDTAVGGFQNLLQLRTVIGNRLRVILSPDVLGNEIHGAGPVQRDSRDDVLQIFRLQLLHEVLHAAAFQLEHALSLSRADGSIDCRIVIINLIHVDGLSRPLGRHAGRVLNHCQRPESQEIHLQKAQLLQGRHGKLGRDRAVRSPGQGYILVHFLLADDHARRVHGGVSRKSLQTHGHVNQLMDLRIILIAFPKLRIHLQRLLKGDIQLLGHHLGNGVHKIVGQVHDPSHVP